MENENDFTPSKFYGGGGQAGEGVSVSVARAMQEVQGQIVMAKRFPRDIFQAEKRIMEACKRPGLAKLSQYAYPRGGKVVTGPSIRLAEVLAQTWGNLDFGIRELSQENGESSVEAYCWDLETNVRQAKTFTVKHERKANGKIAKLDDPRDIYELVANNGARRLRACILGIIPQDIVEGAKAICDQTLAGKTDKPLIDRIRDMVKGFDNLGVNKEMIETRISHSVETINLEELIELGKIFNSVKDGMTKRQDWFKFEQEKSETSQNLNDRLGDNVLTPQPPAPEIKAEPHPDMKRNAETHQEQSQPPISASALAGEQKKTAKENTFKI